MLVVAYWFTVFFLNVVPGDWRADRLRWLFPGLSVGLMQAARNVERGQLIGLPTLYGSLKENGCTLAILAHCISAAHWAPPACRRWSMVAICHALALAGNRAERAVVEDADFTLSALFIMLLMTPVLMAWWFAPVLAAWHRLSIGRALFFSFVACWMNWRPS